MASRPRSVCWPDERQELLLGAALGPPETAISAWGNWLAKVDIADVDQGSFRLLPLAHTNLRGALTGEVAATVRGIYRQSWYRNQLLLRRLGETLAGLRLASVPTLVLKGAALSVFAYRDLGARPMKDVDVLVPAGRLTEALAVLPSLDWRSKPEHKDRPTELLAARHFVDSRGQELDLHWQLLHGRPDGETTPGVWASAIEIDIAGERTMALGAADQVVHTIVHGIAWNQVPQIRWLADAALVIRAAGARLDWDRVVSQARARETVPPLRDGLAYLASHLDAAVPKSVIAELNRIRIGLGNRTDYWIRQRSPETVLGHLPVLFADYRLLGRINGTAPTVSGFLRFLRRDLQVEGRRSFVATVVRKAARRLRPGRGTARPHSSGPASKPRPSA
jgi:hypothetical protein